MLHDVFVQPLINLLVAIYAVLPGHDFGFAIIVFTILVRIALWPLVRKQIHQQRAIRELQPDIAKIKAKTKGDKQKEALLVMELYREREINPFASLGLILIQFPILLGLFAALQAILREGVVVEAYSFVQTLGYMKDVVQNPELFSPHLMGIDLGATGNYGIALGAALGQYVQTKQMMPRPKERKKLREILKKSVETGDNSEAMTAMTQGMGSFFSIFMFFISLSLPAALGLYWLSGSIVGILQQRYVLGHDAAEAESKSNVIEGEVVEQPVPIHAKRRKKSGKKR